MDLKDNLIKDVSSLNNLKDLVIFNIMENDIKQANVVEGMPVLEELYMDKAVDRSCLKNIKILKKADLDTKSYLIKKKYYNN